MAEELELTKALEGLAPPETYFDEESGEEITRRRMYPALVLNLLGVMSRYMGLSSGPEIQAELLTDPRWMVSWPTYLYRFDPADLSRERRRGMQPLLCPIPGSAPTTVSFSMAGCSAASRLSASLRPALPAHSAALTWPAHPALEGRG
jgi:hypothetical protein